MVKYGLLSKANFGKSTPFPNGRRGAFFSGYEFAYADYMQKAGDAHGASRLSGEAFALANLGGGWNFDRGSGVPAGVKSCLRSFPAE